MSPVELEILRDALSCLLQYHKHGEDMRIIGRGFHPTGRHGHSIENVIENLDRVIQDHETIPQIQPVKTRTVKLDPKTWKD